MSAKKKKNSGQNNRAAVKKVDPADLAQLLQQTRNLLACHLELGLSGYPVTPELRRLFAREQPEAAGSPSLLHRETVNRESAPAAIKNSESTELQLESISRQLSSCRNCDSVSGSPLPGQGSATPRLFVVGDYGEISSTNSEVIWGADEDELFWKMMAAIGLDQESVYVSNCIKCRQDNVSAPDPALARRCFPFLQQELAAIQPGLICSMGEIATGLLLGSRVPLVRMRGRFHQYRSPHGTVSRVMPTFHPRFLLKHPEMKRAVWLDLQAVQRQL